MGNLAGKPFFFHKFPTSLEFLAKLVCRDLGGPIVYGRFSPKDFLLLSLFRDN
jgi:hypothetical protein